MESNLLIYDRIITLIQNAGGATVLFNELTSRLIRDLVKYREVVYSENDSMRPNSHQSRVRPLERYRTAIIPNEIKLTANDIFHSTCYRLPNDTRCKIVTTVHDFTYEKFIGGAPAFVHTWQKNKAIRNSNHVICVSENTKSDLLYFVPEMREENITVVHNGASDIFKPLEDKCVLPFVLFVGKRGGYKNFESLVVALRQLSSLALYCVGGGNFTSAELVVLDKNIRGKYKHFNNISSYYLNELYNSAFCFVYPSLYEGFGIPIIESMKAGCPVVAVDCSSIREISGNAALLVNLGIPDEFVAEISRLDDVEFRNCIVAKGLSHSIVFSWEQTYKKTIEVYNNI